VVTLGAGLVKTPIIADSVSRRAQSPLSLEGNWAELEGSNETTNPNQSPKEKHSYQIRKDAAIRAANGNPVFSEA
jgi:hypothetical protein